MRGCIMFVQFFQRVLSVVFLLSATFVGGMFLSMNMLADGCLCGGDITEGWTTIFYLPTSIYVGTMVVLIVTGLVLGATGWQKTERVLVPRGATSNQSVERRGIKN